MEIINKKYKYNIPKEDLEKAVNWATKEFWYVTMCLVLFGIVGGFAYSMLKNHMGWGVDDTDLSGKRRSGMHLFIDYRTGVQYLASPYGGITPRIDKDGNLMLWDGQ